MDDESSDQQSVARGPILEPPRIRASAASELGFCVHSEAEGPPGAPAKAN